MEVAELARRGGIDAGRGEPRAVWYLPADLAAAEAPVEAAPHAVESPGWR